jgi:hypothetical protein
VTSYTIKLALLAGAAIIGLILIAMLIAAVGQAALALHQGLEGILAP